MSARTNNPGVPLAAVLAELLPATFAAALVVVAGLVHVTSKVQVVRLGYELAALDKERSELERQKRELSVELATLRAPARLQERARTDLALTLPEVDAVVHLAP